MSADRTRPAREHQASRLMVHTGDGKGKSSAAFGTALRGWAQGWPVAVYQFIKAPSWRTGERVAFQALDAIHRDTGQGGPVSWHVLGAGRSTLRSTAHVDQQALAQAGWALVREDLERATHRLLILDEFTHVLARGWVSPDEAVAVLSARPGNQHIVITGRSCPAVLIEAADLVTDMRKVKHPFDKGRAGIGGLEW